MSKEPKQKPANEAYEAAKDGIGINADGTLNEIAPENLKETLAEIRRMREAEGYVFNENGEVIN